MSKVNVPYATEIETSFKHIKYNDYNIYYYINVHIYYNTYQSFYIVDKLL